MVPFRATTEAVAFGVGWASPGTELCTSEEWSVVAGTSDQIRDVLAAHGNLLVDAATVDDDTDLYSAGLQSHATVRVMLALEEQFNLEFPDSLLRRSTFSNIATLRRVIEELER